MVMKKSKKTQKKSAMKSAAKLVFADKDLLSLRSLGAHDMEKFFALSAQVKKTPEKYMNKLKGKTIALLFQRPSNRTRVAFEVGMAQLGGSSVYLADSEIRMGNREPLKDVARTLSRYFDGIVVRTSSHQEITEFASYSRTPVINGLSDLEHPCQTLADLFTIQSKFGRLKNINITYIGDSNNVLHSLLYGATLMGANLSIIPPRGYEPTEEALKEIRALAKTTGSKIGISNNPFTSIKSAHVIYTDVWISMGQEGQRDQRLRDFQPFQVNQSIVSKAAPDVLIMHCLPAHREEEITDEIIEGPHSIVFEQAENKLHAQKALLLMLLGKKGKA